MSDQDQADNELLLEKLLKWQRHTGPDNEFTGNWHAPDGFTYETFTFEDWGTAGLLIDALLKAPFEELELEHMPNRGGVPPFCAGLRRSDEHGGSIYEFAASGPLAVRAVALHVLRLEG